MKQKVIFSSFFIFFLINYVFAQAPQQQMQFDILDENGLFFTDLKMFDLKINQLRNATLEIKTGNSLEIMVMIDASASQEKTLPIEKKAAQTFIDSFLKTEKDKIAIVSFADKVLLEQDLTNNFQKAKQQIEKIEFVAPSGFIGGGVIIGRPPANKNQAIAGSTSIWDSLKQVLNAFSKINNAESQKAVILISDGVNTYGESKIKEVAEFSIRTKIPIYAIGVGDDNYDGVDKKSLEKLCEQTGGIAVVPKKNLEDLTEKLKSLGQSLRSSYKLSFDSVFTETKGEIQELKVEIANSELRKRKLRIIQPKGIFVLN